MGTQFPKHIYTLSLFLNKNDRLNHRAIERPLFEGGQYYAADIAAKKKH